jgi:thiol-disulfide isomerase/thioredoxin
MYRIAVAALAAFALAAAAPALAGGKKGDGDKKFLLDAKGKVAQDDPKFKDKLPYKLHKLKLEKGAYVIEMMTTDEGFDPFLIVEAPGGKLFSDDDGGAAKGRGTLDSWLLLRVGAAGEYKIHAASLTGAAGSYHLTVRKATDDEAKGGGDKGEKKADGFEAMIGKPAPEVTGVFSINGETKKLSDLKGKVVVLDFWAVWCGPCIKTFPELQAWDKEFKKEGVEVVGVTWYQKRFGFDKEAGKLTQVKEALTGEQEQGMLKDFIGHHKLEYRIMGLSEEGFKEAAANYGIRGIPHVVVIDRKGVVRMVRVGSGPTNATAIHEEIKKLVAEK